MSRRVLHYFLILLLALGPVQTAFASVSAMDHARCSANMQHDMSMHAGMQHDQSASTDGGQCDCKDCGSQCVAVSAGLMALPGPVHFIANPARTTPVGFQPVTLIGQVPATEIRPPISLQ